MSLAATGTGRSGLISTSYWGWVASSATVTPRPHPKDVHEPLSFSCHHRKGDKERLEQGAIAMEEGVFSKTQNGSFGMSAKSMRC